jgi:branched-chain amino acid transport system ATP-binding protein
MSGALLELSGLRKTFDGIVALNDFSCAVSKGEIVGLIGPNGAGKTTLFNVATGFLRPEHGKMSFKGRQLALIEAIPLG